VEGGKPGTICSGSIVSAFPALSAVVSFHVKMVLSIFHRLVGSELPGGSPCTPKALLLYLSQSILWALSTFNERQWILFVSGTPKCGASTGKLCGSDSIEDSSTETTNSGDTGQHIRAFTVSISQHCQG
jgi:hypothetical protein